ncbi:MAG: pantoate--beta-alanine ligase [Pseudomonadales bacterium]
MRISKRLEDWRQLRAELTGSLGFVPTMGALHQGHAALIRRSVAENDHSVLSIYVNPTQFDDPGDLARYPCTLEQDLELARSLGVSAVLLPRYDELYADGFRYQVTENRFSRELCGAHRAGHFTGVLTVVLKLLNLVRPRRAYFGEKDYQQYLLVRDMCAALFIDVEIVPCETVREVDGLAMSSRNALLDARGRALAPLLHRLLTSDLDDAEVAARLAAAGFAVDYVESRAGRRFGAAAIEGGGRRVRLIDNVARAGGESSA